MASHQMGRTIYTPQVQPGNPQHRIFFTTGKIQYLTDWLRLMEATERAWKSENREDRSKSSQETEPGEQRGDSERERQREPR